MNPLRQFNWRVALVRIFGLWLTLCAAGAAGQGASTAAEPPPGLGPLSRYRMSSPLLLGRFGTPIPAGHPLLGSWRGSHLHEECSAEIVVLSDGTKSAQSAGVHSRSHVIVSEFPSRGRLYRLADRMVEGTAPNCSGLQAHAGEVLVQVVRIHPDGSRFLLCDGEEMVQCFAEFYRIVGEGAR